MSDTANQLADQLDTTTRDFIDVVESVSPQQWTHTTNSENWSVGVVAHHVAVSYPQFVQLTNALAAGVKLPEFTQDQLHQGNAEHAREFANASKAETLDLLRNGGDELSRAVRGLSDEQLANTTDSFFGGEMSLQQIIERIYIGHPKSHLESIRATTA